MASRLRDLVAVAAQERDMKIKTNVRGGSDHPPPVKD